MSWGQFSLVGLLDGLFGKCRVLLRAPPAHEHAKHNNEPDHSDRSQRENQQKPLVDPSCHSSTSSLHWAYRPPL